VRAFLLPLPDLIPTAAGAVLAAALALPVHGADVVL